MKNLSLIILSTLGLLVFGAFVGWRVHVAAHTLTTVEGLVFDPSSSHMGSKDRACGAMTSLAAALLAAAPAPGTKLTVMELGNAHSGGEPLLLTTSDSEPSRHNLASGIGKLKKDREAYLASIHHACDSAPSPEYSAIYAAVGRMLENVHTYNCGSAAACSIWVSTDGIENVSAPLRDKIAGTSSETKPVLKLPNGAVDVHFCGLAESSLADPAQRNHRSAFHAKPDPIRVESAWRSAFTDPDRVTFAPFCPQPPAEFQALAKSAAEP